PGALALYVPGPARWSVARYRYCNLVTPDCPFSSAAHLVPGRVGTRRVSESSHCRCCSDRCSYRTHLLLVLLAIGDTTNSTTENGGVTCLTPAYNNPMIKRSQPLLTR